MTEKFLTRMGDGERVSLTAAEIREDLEAGNQDAADRGKIPALSADEIDQLFAIVTDPNRITGVKPGNEVITTDDGGPNMIVCDKPDGGVGLPMGYHNAVLAFERLCCADTIGVGHYVYSCKPVKSLINYEKQRYYMYSQAVTAPLIYGTQPNLGVYFKPDGPFPNATELIPEGKIEEGQRAQEAAAEALTEDLIYIAKELYSAG